MNYCLHLTVASNGWRLPTKDELLSIVDKTWSNPTIDGVAFPDTPSQGFWSSSAYTDSPGPTWGSSPSAWEVFFDVGSLSYSNTDGTYRVRCVR